MKFDREALSDCFDACSLANEIRTQFGIGHESVPLEDIAAHVGIFNIKEDSLGSIEGALVVPPGKIEGEILLNAGQYPQRKRFTLAHELGHFVHPEHHAETDGRFNCSPQDIFQTYNRETFPDIENQANEFASNLLISNESIQKLVQFNENLDFGSLIDFCEKLKVSKAFAIRKFQPVAQSKIAFIFSRNGVVRYAQSDNFPYMKVWSRDCLPDKSSALFDGPDNSVLKKKLTDPAIWLKNPPDRNLYEQTLIQERGYRITMLILE